MMRAIALAISVGLASGGLPGRAWGAAAQPAGYVPREQRNGALKYWEAWTLISPDLNAKLGAVDWDAIGTNTDIEKMPQAFKDVLAEPLDVIINSLDNAASHPRCDFEVQWEDGALALLPHLSKLRAGARVCRVVGRAELCKGDADRAAHVTGLMFTQAKRAAQDPLLINSLVGIAIGESALSEVDAIVASGRLTPGAKAVLLARLREIDQKDPMNTRASIVGERDTFVPWIERMCATKESIAKLRDIAVQEMGVGGDAGKAYFDGLTSDKVRADIDGMNRAYARLLELWDMGNAPSELDAFAKQIQDGGYGTMTTFFLPSISRAKVSQDKFRTHLVSALGALEKAPTKQP